jgi:two-component system, chemotaxis family, protein-glutamate methylesterase/glutaminase
MDEGRGSAPEGTANEPVKVMVVGDFDPVTGAILRALADETGISIVAKPVSGDLAVSRLRRQDVDVVLLDIGSPKEDGAAPLPRLLAVDPHLKVIIVSTLTFSNVRTSLRGLMAGAAEFMPVPVAPGGAMGGEKANAFRRDLVEKIKALGAARRRLGERKIFPAYRHGPVVLRKNPPCRPDIILIGSSTGGPRVLHEIFARLPKVVSQPILVVQHLPATFTSFLADHIARKSSWPCHEGVDGENLLGGTVYVAPAGIHMTVESRGSGMHIRLIGDPPVNSCRPSVDVLFQSAVRACGARTLGVVLTGMGQDGLDGSRAIVDAGGTIIAQDEDTSVVWGMPGAVATAGLCSAVLPARDIAPHVREIATLGR